MSLFDELQKAFDELNTINNTLVKTNENLLKALETQKENYRKIIEINEILSKISTPNKTTGLEGLIEN